MEVSLQPFRKVHIQYHRYLKKYQLLFSTTFMVINMQDYHKKKLQSCSIDSDQNLLVLCNHQRQLKCSQVLGLYKEFRVYEDIQ